MGVPPSPANTSPPESLERGLGDLLAEEGPLEGQGTGATGSGPQPAAFSEATFAPPPPPSGL